MRASLQQSRRGLARLNVRQTEVCRQLLKSHLDADDKLKFVDDKLKFVELKESP